MSPIERYLQVLGHRQSDGLLHPLPDDATIHLPKQHEVSTLLTNGIALLDGREKLLIPECPMIVPHMHAICRNGQICGAEALLRICRYQPDTQVLQAYPPHDLHTRGYNVAGVADVIPYVNIDKNRRRALAYINMRHCIDFISHAGFISKGPIFAQFNGDASDVADDAVIDMLADSAKRAYNLGVYPERHLTWELVEDGYCYVSGLFENLEFLANVRRNLVRLSNMGVRIAVDDMFSGYSDLIHEHVGDLVNVRKIGGTIYQSAKTEEQKIQILKYALYRTMHMHLDKMIQRRAQSIEGLEPDALNRLTRELRIIVEHVETAEMADFIGMFQFDPQNFGKEGSQKRRVFDNLSLEVYTQGFYPYKPMAAGQLLNLMGE